MDPALLRERELFKLKASAIPVYVHYFNIKLLYFPIFIGEYELTMFKLCYRVEKRTKEEVSNKDEVKRKSRPLPPMPRPPSPPNSSSSLKYELFYISFNEYNNLFNN